MEKGRAGTRSLWSARPIFYRNNWDDDEKNKKLYSQRVGIFVLRPTTMGIGALNDYAS